jgi:hypothetical protein
MMCGNTWTAGRFNHFAFTFPLVPSSTSARRRWRNPPVQRSTLTLGLAVDGDKQRFVVIALMHIVWLEILVPAL